MDDVTPDAAEDTSGHAHQAKAVNAARSEGHDGRGGRRFDGKGYIESGGLGTHEAMSIALWVKAETLGNQWNPLLFCHDGQAGAVHFSLLSDGTPNVAINTGEWNWTHRRAQDFAGRRPSGTTWSSSATPAWAEVYGSTSTADCPATSERDWACGWTWPASASEPGTAGKTPPRTIFTANSTKSASTPAC